MVVSLYTTEVIRSYGSLLCTGFLTAVLQNHARRAGVSVDSLSFAFRVHENPEDTNDSLNDVKQKINIKEAGFKVRCSFV